MKGKQGGEPWFATNMGETTHCGARFLLVEEGTDETSYLKR